MNRAPNAFSVGRIVRILVVAFVAINLVRSIVLAVRGAWRGDDTRLISGIALAVIQVAVLAAALSRRRKTAAITKSAGIK